MAHQVNYRIGADVICEDAACGQVAKLVVDPYTHRVTDLIVEEGFLFKNDTVVPVDHVESVTKDRIKLAVKKSELDHFTEYNEKHYVAPPKGWTRARYGPEYMLHRVTLGGMIHPVTTATPTPMIVHRVHEGISPTKAVIERGIDVLGIDGKIGTVDHVIVDRESAAIKLLVVDRGLLRDHVVIPAERVTDVNDKRIRVGLSDAQIEDLYHYTPRSPVDILPEVKDRLARIPVDPDSIGIGLDGGIITLSGVVPNARIRRRILGTVGPIEGILHIEDKLDTAETIQARVVSALRSDPRTDIADIDVIAKQGMVTLKGQVDCQEIKDAARAIAARQKGVAEVINDLEIEDDENSAYLRIAWMVRTALLEGMGTGTGASTHS